jgi:hypothetical protein
VVAISFCSFLKTDEPRHIYSVNSPIDSFLINNNNHFDKDFKVASLLYRLFRSSSIKKEKLPVQVQPKSTSTTRLREKTPVNMTVPSDITLYTDNTPNGAKAPIILEELGLPYKLEHLSIQSGKQKEEYVAPQSLDNAF